MNVHESFPQVNFITILYIFNRTNIPVIFEKEHDRVLTRTTFENGFTDLNNKQQNIVF